MNRRVVCGVDVGTGSARAGFFDARGRLLGRAEHAFSIHEPRPGHAEHSSEAIWRAVCQSVRAARIHAGVEPEEVVGIGFDATCSLVLRDRDGAPLPLSVSDGTVYDTIVWLDHRALAEADECTATGHRVLREAGGAMSPEMQIPKLMWVKRNRPDLWASAGYFFDLVDFLSWRASGSLARSHCALVCKWTYLPLDGGWQPDFLDSVGLSDMLARGALPARSSPVGSLVGQLSTAAAAELGLPTSVKVGAGFIDAHAGALGILGGVPAPQLAHDLALVAGTSSCVMALGTEPRAFLGGWGPYLGATLPALWISEGGQSASGALLDHLIRWHGAGGEPDASAHARIVARVAELRAGEGRDFAARLHVLPDFHGNRAPLSDPHALGVVSGLTLDASFDSLCRLYYRACVAIALGVRHILEGLARPDGPVTRLHVTGGHTKNPLLMELYADATGCAVFEPAAEDAVLLGSAMVAASAADLYPDLAAAGLAMSQPGRERKPNPASRAGYDRDYRIFLEMHRQRQALDAMA